MPTRVPGLSKASTRQVLRALAPHQEFLQNFSGGLNLRDSPLELAPNESPYASTRRSQEALHAVCWRHGLKPARPPFA